VNFGMALATRKDDLSALDKTLLVVAKAIDTAVKVFGGKSNLAKGIEGKKGIMVVSDNYHSVPKILYMEGGRIPSNHRDLLSAKAIYNFSYIQSSLANATFSGQKLIYSGVEIPFNFHDFLEVSENAYFTDEQGREAKFNNCQWNSETSRAVADYEVLKVYTRNLVETYTEQG
jgi:hypothetical protein